MKHDTLTTTGIRSAASPPVNQADKEDEEDGIGAMLKGKTKFLVRVGSKDSILSDKQ